MYWKLEVLLENFACHPYLATENALLRKLFKKRSCICLEEEQQVAFEKVEKLLGSKEILGFLSTRLIVDDSSVGLGVVLIQLKNGVSRIIKFLQLKVFLMLKKDIHNRKKKF